MQARPLNPKLKIETISSAWWPQQLFTTIGQNIWQQWQQLATMANGNNGQPASISKSKHNLIVLHLEDPRIKCCADLCHYIYIYVILCHCIYIYVIIFSTMFEIYFLVFIPALGRFEEPSWNPPPKN